MELHQLRYFEAIARLGNVSRAADELHLAQPSLSKQLRVLEAELGTPLFDRVGRHLELTDAGRLLLPYARRVLDEVAAARDAMREQRTLERGRVALGVTPTVGTNLLPEQLAAFNKLHPGIDLEVQEAGARRLLELLAAGSVHLAVVPIPVAGVRWAELWTEDLVVAVAPDHYLAGRAVVRATDLADEAFIFFPAGYDLRERTLQVCRTAGFAPRIVLDGGEMDTVLRCAAAGLGVAIVPRLALNGATGVVGLPIADQQVQRTLGLVWHLERQLSPAADALRTFMLERLTV